jgi:hypothetical protein
MDAAAYEAYVKELHSRLLAEPQVRGLMVVGSAADPEKRDAWSDHDFWVITEPGAQGRFLDSTAWLPDADQIILSNRHGASYRTVLYGNQHKIDYAVVDEEELASGTFERFEVIFDRGEVLSRARAGVDRTRRDRIETLRHSFTLQGFGILVWTAYGRAARGELLSARTFLELAADVLLNLLCVHTSLGRVPSVDSLDPRRRLERNNPRLALELLRILTNETLPACRQLLTFAERELRERDPSLGWEEIDQLKSWLGDSESRF